MAVSTTCTGVRKAGGKIFIAFGKTEYEFENAGHVKRWIGDALSKDMLQAILIAKWLDADPTAATPSLVIGKTITADLSQGANIVRVS